MVVEHALARPDPAGFLRRVRETLANDVPAAIIGSSAMRLDNAMPVGFGAVLACPLRARDVVERTAALTRRVLLLPVGERAASSLRPRTSDRSPAVRWRVLLAEDNAVNQKVAVRLLERLRCEVDVAADGEEAVAKALVGGHDMVFMDCHMPRLDGYAATRRLRESVGAARRLPIVALTASVLDVERAACLAAGMNDVIHKPVRAAELRAMLERYGSAPARPSLAP